MERQEKVFKLAFNHRTMYFETMEAAVHFKENVASTEIQEMTWEQYDQEMKDWRSKNGPSSVRIKEA